MNSTTLTQIRELLEKLIPLLQEDVSTLKQEASRQEPLIQRLLQREIEEREALIPRLKEGVKHLSCPIDPPDRPDITVIMFDGEIIEEAKVVDTFIKAIEEIGIEKVKELNIIAFKNRKLPLISDYEDTKNTQKQLGQHFIVTRVSTDDKLKWLHEINSRLKIGMQIRDNRKDA